MGSKKSEPFRLPIELVNILKNQRDNLSKKAFDDFLNDIFTNVNSKIQLKNEYLGIQRKNIEIGEIRERYVEKMNALSESDIIREKDLIITLKNEEIESKNVQISALKKLI